MMVYFIKSLNNLLKCLLLLLHHMRKAKCKQTIKNSVSTCTNSFYVKFFEAPVAMSGSRSEETNIVRRFPHEITIKTPYESV